LDFNLESGALADRIKKGLFAPDQSVQVTGLSNVVPVMPFNPKCASLIVVGTPVPAAGTYQKSLVGKLLFAYITQGSVEAEGSGGNAVLLVDGQVIVVSVMPVVPVGDPVSPGYNLNFDFKSGIPINQSLSVVLTNDWIGYIGLVIEDDSGAWYIEQLAASP